MDILSAHDNVEILPVGDRYDSYKIVSGDHSYIVRPTSGLTGNDVEAIKRCPPPNFRTDGTVSRIVNIHDSKLSATGLPSRRGKVTSFLHMVKGNGDEFGSEGEYYELNSFGTSLPYDGISHISPRLFGLFHDVTSDFLADSDGSDVFARESIGPVFQRVVLDVDPDNCFSVMPIKSCGLIAPDLDILPADTAHKILRGCGYESREAFEADKLDIYTGDYDEAKSLVSQGAFPLEIDAAECLDDIRLALDSAIQEEAYEALFERAEMAIKAIPLPAELKIGSARTYSATAPRFSR